MTQKQLNLQIKALIKRIKKDDIDINVVNLDCIASVYKSHTTYLVNAKNDQSDYINRYFIFQGVAHIMAGHAETWEGTYFTFAFEEVDILALGVYIYLGFPVSALVRSVLFATKLQNPDFYRLFTTGLIE